MRSVTSLSYCNSAMLLHSSPQSKSGTGSLSLFGGEEGTILWARNRLQWLVLESLKTQDAHVMTTDLVSKANGMGWCY